VALGVEKPGAAEFLLERLEKENGSQDITAKSLRHIARYLPVERSDEVALMVASRFAEDPDFQLELLRSMQEGAARRGGTVGAGTRNWANDVITQVLASADEGLAGWTELPLPGATDTRSTWTVKPRACSDGHNNHPFFTSSEVPMGILRSQS